MDAIKLSSVDVLRQLVELKEHKDEFGVTEHYKTEKPKLWLAAKATIVKHDNKKKIEQRLSIIHNKLEDNTLNKDLRNALHDEYCFLVSVQSDM